jgi:hypothetical protein
MLLRAIDSRADIAVTHGRIRLLHSGDTHTTPTGLVDERPSARESTIDA